eukprot:maker-scaffold10_size831480-snap-gene-7.23 protein:Tk01843 transcript:maker-scaffold10_size831480-snap-gene-7.23-mRNA-1 annotation:"GI19521"
MCYSPHSGHESHKLPSSSVPPSWILKPQSQDTIVGARVELPCQASGSPPPSIVWKKAMASRPGEFLELFPSLTAVSSPSLSLIEVVDESNWFWAQNGSLILARAQPEKSGRYLCQVSNGIGQDLNQMVTFTVKAPPQIIFGAKDGMVSSAVGAQSTLLECEAKGDKPISVTWNKNGQNLMSPNSEGRYSMETLTTGVGVKSVLTIRQVIKKDEDKYSCHMKNPYGADSRDIFLLVQEPPRPPVDLQVGQVKSDSVHLVWSMANSLLSGHSGTKQVKSLPILKFIIDIAPINVPWDSIGTRGPSSEGAVRRLTEDGGHRTSASILNLKPYVDYKVRIMAENALGVGKPSQEIKFRTSGSAPSGQVRDVRVKSTQPTSISIQWEDPQTDSWNGPLSAYKIGWKEALVEPMESGVNWTEIERHDTSDLKVTLQDLTAFTQYKIIIQAINAFGLGPTQTVGSRTQADVPRVAPADIRCRSVGPTSIEIFWTPLKPHEIRGDLLQYNIHYQDTESGFPDRAPSPPSALKVLKPTSSSITLSWLPPAGLKRERLSHFTVYQQFRKNGQVEIVPTTLPTSTSYYEIRDLDRSVFHSFWITATNDVGEGKPSVRVDVRLRDLDEQDSVLLSLNQTLTVIKSHTAILGCEFLRDESGRSKQFHRLWTKDGSVLSGSSNRFWSVKDELRIRNTRERDSGNYSCIVKTPHLEEAVHYNLVIQDVPEAPEIHINGLQPDAIALELRVAQGQDSLPLISCMVYYKQMYGNLQHLIVPGRQIHDITLQNLECGRTYQIYGRCVNRLGQGSMSKQVSRRTSGDKPHVPDEPDFVHPSNHSVRLDLYRWDSPECPVSYFVVEYKLLE